MTDGTKALFDAVRDALEHANKFRSDGNDRRYQEALQRLNDIELAYVALREQRDRYRTKAHGIALRKA